ncbi:MAG TPA: hypothetical protein GYA05_03300 [Acholeplasmataceae bacterium]|jgi:hypothetical protein|nr:hypothetical protein [Acholeplasmataceae bacterium]
MDLFRDYLRNRLGQEVPACAFIDLRRYAERPEPELKEKLEEVYRTLKDSDSLIKFPFLFGYLRLFRNYENIGGLLQEFITRKEQSVPYLQACFLALEVWDEMLYDEFRRLCDLLGEVMLGFKTEMDVDPALVLLPSLYYNYLGPEFLELIPKTDFDNDLFKEWKEKLKERYPS